MSTPLPTSAPASAGSRTGVASDPAVAKELRTAAKKIVLLYNPWANWIVSGMNILGGMEENYAGLISASDRVGSEILSLVPPGVVAEFFTAGG